MLPDRYEQGQQDSQQSVQPGNEARTTPGLRTGDIINSAVVVGDNNITVVVNLVGGQPTRIELPKPDAPTQPGALPPGSYLPFTRNALFTGRVADLQQLEHTLLRDHASSTLISEAIEGMGGIGKTQLAVEFAFRHGHKFRGVHWLDVRDPATLDSQMARCGAQMMIQPWPEKQPEQVLLTTATWKTDGPRLIILDNFEDPSVGAQVLSRLQHPNVRILVTSRRFDWPAHLGIHSLAIEVFSDPESVEFLGKYTRARFTASQLTMLAKRLGYLPLALELAGRYLERHPRLTVEQYEKRLEQAMDDESMRGFRKEMPDATGHDLDLLSTFSLSWAQVHDESAQKAFILAGYCAPNTPIPTEIFEKSLALDQEKCDGALVLLQDVGLLKQVGEGPAIHPLLAGYARHLDQENANLAALTDQLANIAEACNAEVARTGRYSLYTPILPHVRSVAERAEAAQTNKAGELWNSLGKYLQEPADYEGAKAAFERALGIDAAAFGPNHPNVARDMNNLGGVLIDLGDLTGAKTALERALQIDEAALGPNHPDVARDANDLGIVLQDLGDLPGAKAALERALQIGEATLGPNHPRVATRVSNLGSVLEDLGDFPGAKAAYQRALQIDEVTVGSNHPDAAVHLNNLGGVLRVLGDLHAARAAYERALQIDEAAFGPEHPLVGIRSGNLAKVLMAQGDLSGARAAIERALRIHEAKFGSAHPLVGTSIAILGNVLRDLGDLPAAKAAYERALQIFKQVLPEGHQRIKTVEENLKLVEDKLKSLEGK